MIREVGVTQPCAKVGVMTRVLHVGMTLCYYQDRSTTLHILSPLGPVAQNPGWLGSRAAIIKCHELQFHKSFFRSQFDRKCPTLLLIRPNPITEPELADPAEGSGINTLRHVAVTCNLPGSRLAG